MKFDPVELASELIKLETVTPDSGVGISFIKEKLESIGFKCIVKAFHSPESQYQTYNLYAKIGGDIGDNLSENICFAGHTDVVPTGPLSEWKHPPFAANIVEVDGEDVLYGRGASDMKGAVACFVAACSDKDVLDALLKTNNNDKSKSISLLITGDEEGHAIDGTEKMLDYLYREHGERIDFTIVGEASCSHVLGDAIKIGRRGSLTIDLEIIGKQGHTAYPEKAQNPINDMVPILYELNNIQLDAGDENFAPSKLVVTSVDVGNIASNIIPQKVSAKMNIRFNTHHNFNSLRKIVHNICDKYCKQSGCKFSITTHEGAVPFMAVKNIHDNKYLSNFIKTVKDVTSISPELNTKGGTSDGRFLHKYSDVIEFGVPNPSIHKINEYVRVSDLQQLTEVYKRFILNYFKV